MNELTIVSVDDHMVEPPHLWQSRLPAHLKDRGPKATDTEHGVVWEIDGQRTPFHGFNATVGYQDDLTQMPEVLHWDDMRPGCYDPHERMKDMDIDGIIASLCFPSSVPGFGGTVFNKMEDRELGLACIQAYNDYQTDEWAAADPQRLYAMILVPYWDPRLAAAEVERCAAKGARAVAFSENPPHQGYPSIHNVDRYWDPFFAAAQDAAMPLCMHIGSSSRMLATAEDAPNMVRFGVNFMNAVQSMIEWLLSDQFERFPQLKVVFSEGYVGWIPFVREHCDREWHTHAGWTHHPLPKPPSEYFEDHVFGCFIEDPVGADLIERIGVGNVMLESDYPHPDGTWPNTKKVVEEHLRHLSPENRLRVMRSNAEQLFRMNLPV
jgi:predicted TIM-barrel fold metal-dependent hydrolase